MQGSTFLWQQPSLSITPGNPQQLAKAGVQLQPMTYTMPALVTAHSLRDHKAAPDSHLQPIWGGPLTAADH
jgi:hypothetical protein